MITWLTHMSYGKTARALDDRTLGHQRVEAFELFDALLGGGDESLLRRPVAKMWVGCEYALGVYGMLMCMEWTNSRGCADSLFFKFYNAIQEIKKEEQDFSYVEPPWFRDVDVLRSHRSNLIRRQREHGTGQHYLDQFGKKTPDSMPYLWPVMDDRGGYKLLVTKAEKELLRTGDRKLPSSTKARVANLD